MRFDFDEEEYSNDQRGGGGSEGGLEEAVGLFDFSDFEETPPSNQPESTAHTQPAETAPTEDTAVSDNDTEPDWSISNYVENSFSSTPEYIFDDSGTYEREPESIYSQSADDSTERFYVTEEEPEEFYIDDCLSAAFDAGASDVHVKSEGYVAFTKLGEIEYQKRWGKVPASIVEDSYRDIASNVLQSDFSENFELDMSYTLRTGKHEGRRVRANIGRSFSNIYMVFRLISDTIPTPEALGVPLEMQEWMKTPNGAIILGGTTGSGKTTTFASLIRKVQLNEPRNIVTIESPVEFVYPDDGKALVTQREIGMDARSFNSALVSCMRMNPDIILVGECRHRLEVETFVQAAESGHFTMTTMHTNTPALTLSRIRSMYEGSEREQILDSLSGSLLGLVNQTLVKSIDGSKRFAVHSVLPNNEEVSELIRLGNVTAVEEYLREHKRTMEHALARYVNEGKITEEEAIRKSPSASFLKSLLKR